jgi:hypothetical protein
LDRVAADEQRGDNFQWSFFGDIGPNWIGYGCREKKWKTRRDAVSAFAALNRGDAVTLD